MNPNDQATDRSKGASAVSSTPKGSPPKHGPCGPSKPAGSSIKSH